MPQPLALSALAPIYATVAKPPDRPRTWPFGKKLEMWLAEHGESMPSFAKRAGIPYGSLHAYATADRKIPSTRLQRIAVASRLPADYWLNDDLPYPPPSEYGPDIVERVRERLAAFPADLLNELLDALADENELRSMLALRRAALGLRLRPRPSSP